MNDSDNIKIGLRSVPYKLLAAELAKRNSERRKAKSGGRPKVLKPCPTCGMLLGSREMIKHKPQCGG